MNPIQPEEIRKGMLITILGVKPQPVKLKDPDDDPEGFASNVAIRIGQAVNMSEVAWSQHMQGVPMVVVELQFPYIACRKYWSNAPCVPVDTRVTELMEVDECYARAIADGRSKGFFRKLFKRA